MQVLTSREASPREKESRAVPSRACDSCRQKKQIKCDRALPQCDWCRHHNRICTFSRPAQRRGKKNLEHLGLELERRIVLIERALTQKLRGDSLSEAEAVRANARNNESLLSLQVVGQWVGMVNSYNGFPFFSSEGQKWVQECTGQRIRFPSISPSDAPHPHAQHALLPFKPLQPLPNADMDLLTQLPSKEVLVDHAESWKSSYLWRVFPVFTNAQIDQIIHTAYSDATEPGSLEFLSTRSFLHAFLAFSTIFGLTIPFKARIDGPASAEKAQNLLFYLMWMPDTTKILQAIIMLAYFNAVRGELQSVDMLMAMGARIIFSLGAHKFPGPDVEAGSGRPSPLRNLFWLLYILDKDMSIRTGRPPCIADDQCDLTLPEDETVTDGDHDQPLPHLGAIRLRMSIIKSRAFDSLYSVHALQKSDAELLRAIIGLDDELEQWRMSVPASWRPPLAFSQPGGGGGGGGSSSGGGTPVSATATTASVEEIPQVLTRLEYFHCAAIIHQASSRCQVWDGAGQLVKGVRSSSELSVAASRSTLQYLDGISATLRGNVFWIVLLYATSSVLTLFCHILSDPRNPAARRDIAFLERAPALLHHGRSLSHDALLPNEAVRLKAVTDFLDDLAHLAPLAIGKAAQAEPSAASPPSASTPGLPTSKPFDAYAITPTSHTPHTI